MQRATNFTSSPGFTRGSGTRILGALGIGVCLLAMGAPAGADDEAAGKTDPKQLKELLAICDRWGTKTDDKGRYLVEYEVRDLPPLRADAAAKVAERIFELAAENGPKLKKAGKSYFYDKDAKKGLYYIKKGKKGGGLLIAMHGGGEGSGDGGSAFSVWGSAGKEGFTVIAPEVMKKVGSAWNEEREEQMVLDLIAAAKRTFEIDTNKICLAGHSMGGDGSWMLGGRNADMISAAAPLAGSVMPYMRPGVSNRGAAKEDYLGLMEGVVPNLMHLSYYIFHSDDDWNEPVAPDDIATGYLKKLQAIFPGRYEHVYERVDGIGHALPPKGIGYIAKYMASKDRTPYPDEVVWETWWPWKRQMYWLYHPEPDNCWRFHAKVVGENHVHVTFTSKPEAGRTEPKQVELTLLLSPEMFDFDKPFKVTAEKSEYDGGGEVVLYEGPIARSLWSILVTAGRRNDPKQWFQGHLKVSVPRLIWWDLWEGRETK